MLSTSPSAVKRTSVIDGSCDGVSVVTEEMSTLDQQQRDISTKKCENNGKDKTKTRRDKTREGVRMTLA